MSFVRTYRFFSPASRFLCFQLSLFCLESIGWSWVTGFSLCDCDGEDTTGREEVNSSLHESPINSWRKDSFVDWVWVVLC